MVIADEVFASRPSGSAASARVPTSGTVAVLEWQQTEDLLSLCVDPVAVADSKGFELWDSAEELPEGVKDVGTRGEPNLEALFSTNPDLVVVEAYTAEDEILEQLAKYDVPVLATKGADAEDPVAEEFEPLILRLAESGMGEGPLEQGGIAGGAAENLLQPFDRRPGRRRAAPTDRDRSATG